MSVTVLPVYSDNGNYVTAAARGPRRRGGTRAGRGGVPVSGSGDVFQKERDPKCLSRRGTLVPRRGADGERGGNRVRRDARQHYRGPHGDRPHAGSGVYSHP